MSDDSLRFDHRQSGNKDSRICNPDLVQIRKRCSSTWESDGHQLLQCCNGERTSDRWVYYQCYIYTADLIFYKYVDEFVYELGRDETDHRARAKIDSLKLTEDEWKQVENFIDLLKVSHLFACWVFYSLFPACRQITASILVWKPILSSCRNSGTWISAQSVEHPSNTF